MNEIKFTKEEKDLFLRGLTAIQSITKNMFDANKILLNESRSIHEESK